MNRHRISSARDARRQRRQSQLERIGAFLERTNEASNAEFIRLMRLSYFGDVDEFEKSGTVKLPQ